MAGELSDDELAFLHGVLDSARDGRTDELAAFIERGVPVNLTNAAGDTLLILAAYHDHPGTVRMLLDRGADPDRVNDRGQTALAAAVFRRSAESVTLLLERGADPDAGARSATDVARFFELDEMAALLSRGAASRPNDRAVQPRETSLDPGLATARETSQSKLCRPPATQSR